MEVLQTGRLPYVVDSSCFLVGPDSSFYTVFGRNCSQVVPKVLDGRRSSDRVLNVIRNGLAYGGSDFGASASAGRECRRIDKSTVESTPTAKAVTLLENLRRARSPWAAARRKSANPPSVR